MRWLFFCFFALFCAACHSPSARQAKRLKIYLGTDSQTVCVSGLEYSVLQDLKNDSLTRDAWQGIFPVYRMPADSDMKDLQHEQPGTYQLTDSTLIFKPDTAFKKHQQYIARFYGTGSNFSIKNLIRSKSDLKGPGYIEVVFRF